MAIYHCSIKIGSRSAGRSAVAAAAYRAGRALYEEETQKTHDYTRKGGVICSEIMLPAHAPAEYSDRQALWNAVHKKEKAKNAQLWREVEVALPVELSREQQIEIIRNYVNSQFVSAGMCADWALHDKGNGNPHAHIMLTTRPLKETGEWDVKERKRYKLDENGEKIAVIDKKTGKQKIGAKNRKMWQRETMQVNDWNSHDKAEIWRKAWATECNKHLAESQQIDHRSYKRQNISKTSTLHVGVTQTKMRQLNKVLDFDKTEINEQIKNDNAYFGQVRGLLEQFKQKVRKAHDKLSNILQGIRDNSKPNRRRVKNGRQLSDGVGLLKGRKGEVGGDSKGLGKKDISAATRVRRRRRGNIQPRDRERIIERGKRLFEDYKSRARERKRKIEQRERRAGEREREIVKYAEAIKVRAEEQVATVPAEKETRVEKSQVRDGSSERAKAEEPKKEEKNNERIRRIMERRTAYKSAGGNADGTGGIESGELSIEEEPVYKKVKRRR